MLFVADPHPSAELDPTLLAVLSIFGGAALTALAGFIGSSVQSNREQKHWVRGERLKVYQQVHQLVEEMRYNEQDRVSSERYLENAERLAKEQGMSDSARKELVKRLSEAFVTDRHSAKGMYVWSREILARKIEIQAALALVGTPRVTDCLERVFGALADKDNAGYRTSLENLEREMRKSLSIT